MSSSTRRDLSYISFEGTSPTRPRHACTPWVCGAARAAAAPPPEDRLDEFIAWVLGRAGLDASAYRTQSLHRRLPACLRALEVHSTHAARELLERRPHLVATVVNSLLIGVTEFFREPGAFDFLRARILPEWSGGTKPLRIWSAACSTGEEVYSVAILLAEAGLLDRSDLLGTDCRDDAIRQARLGLYDAMRIQPIESATLEKYFEPGEPAQQRSRHTPCAAPAHGVRGVQWRPVDALRRQVRWKVVDLLAGVEEGPWDMIFWRNAAMYLKPHPAERLWRRLAAVLAPAGVLVAGKAERPPMDAGLTQVGRCVYRAAHAPGRVPAGKQAILENFQ